MCAQRCGRPGRARAAASVALGRAAYTTELEPDNALCVAMLKHLAMPVQATALSVFPVLLASVPVAVVNSAWGWQLARGVAVGRVAYSVELCS